MDTKTMQSESSTKFFQNTIDFLVKIYLENELYMFTLQLLFFYFDSCNLSGQRSVQQDSLM